MREKDMKNILKNTMNPSQVQGKRKISLTKYKRKKQLI